MSEIVDKALKNYELSRDIDPLQIALLREQISQYIRTLMSAGQSDPLQLREYAHAYLKELHEGGGSMRARAACKLLAM